MLSVSLLLQCIYHMCTCIYNRDVSIREEMFLLISLAVICNVLQFLKISPDLKFPFITISYQILIAQHIFDLFNWLSYLNKILSLVQNLANTTSLSFRHLIRHPNECTSVLHLFLLSLFSFLSSIFQSCYLSIHYLQDKTHIKVSFFKI